MKTPKLITAIIAILLFSNFLFAGNPTTETADDISTTMVENTNNDVALSTPQKEVLKMKAKEYAVCLQKARAMTNKEESYAFMVPVTESYEAALDSILTSDQKVKKEKKEKERQEIFTINKNEPDANLKTANDSLVIDSVQTQNYYYQMMENKNKIK